jgi:hypothetical protein
MLGLRWAVAVRKKITGRKVFRAKGKRGRAGQRQAGLGQGSARACVLCARAGIWRAGWETRGNRRRRRGRRRACCCALLGRMDLILDQIYPVPAVSQLRRKKISSFSHREESEKSFKWEKIPKSLYFLFLSTTVLILTVFIYTRRQCTTDTTNWRVSVHSRKAWAGVEL